MVTLQQIILATPAAKLRAAQFVQPLNDAMQKYGISTPLNQAAFLANVFHESGCLAKLEEGLNYSAQRLTEVWPTRFPNLTIAKEYAGNPEKLANRVYADRMGNGPESSGDGFAHRGAGLIQLTGKDNQFKYALEADVDLLTVGDYLRTTQGACDSAAWFWKVCGASAKATSGDFDGACDLVNIGRKTAKEGDAIGYADRLKLYQAFKTVLGA
jgi:putative chitinase